MLKAVKKQFQIMGTELFWTPAIIFGIGILGQILHYVIISSESDNTTCFAMGTVFAVLMFGIVVVITSGMGVGNYFNVEISLGNTRKRFFWSYYIFYVVYYLYAWILVLLLNLAENYLLTILYPTLENEINFFPYLLKYGIPVAVAAPIVSIFFGVLVLRFGVKAFWILWGLWMFGCLGIPRIAEATSETPNSLFGRIGNWAASILLDIPIGMWFIVGIVVYVICMIGSWNMLRKQQVTT